MRQTTASLLLALWLSCFHFSFAFLPRTTTTTTTTTTAPSTRLYETTLPKTLTEETTWDLSLRFRQFPKSSEPKTIRVTGKFIEEVGYEPPQGLFVADNLEIETSRWILSEDPEDRKDGLWVWGLFKEPLYPYLLLTLKIKEQTLLDEQEIPAMTLYAQIPHRRDDGQVILQNCDLQLREYETVQADLFGAAKAEIKSDQVVGQILLQ